MKIISEYIFTVDQTFKIMEHQIPKLNIFSSILAVVFLQSSEARYHVVNEDVVGASPKGQRSNCIWVIDNITV